MQAEGFGGIRGMGSQRNLKLRLEDLGLAVYGFSGSFRLEGLRRH